ncbi:hypothetical protein V8D89_007064 [Ganoderma adspersum]
MPAYCMSPARSGTLYVNSCIIVTVNEDSVTALAAPDVHPNGFLCTASDHKYSIFVPAVAISQCWSSPWSQSAGLPLRTVSRTARI